MDREKLLEQMGLSEGPAAPQVAARPQPLSAEDQTWLSLYKDNLPALAHVSPESYARITANVKAHEVATQPAIERWNEKFSHLPESVREEALQKTMAAIRQDPKHFNADGSLNVAECERTSINLTNEVCAKAGVAGRLLDNEIVDDAIAEREKWLTARRGYGYAGNEVSASQNLPTQR
jgi:hypothetical protein